MERWNQAASLLDALPEAERARPEIRYVRGRVALASGDHERALTLLQALEQRLPMLTEDIAMYRAEAQLHAGQAAAAARFFGARSSPVGLTKAALAWERAGDRGKARQAIDRAIRLARKSHSDEALDARTLRARIAEAQGDLSTAIEDLRFVARHAPDSDQGEAAAAAIERLDPKRALTASEHMDRADMLARRGQSTTALETVDKAMSARGGPPSKLDQLLARARAHYSGRQDYAEAAKLYEQAARTPGPHVPESLYYAAKAWTRADDNDRGLVLYEQLIRRFPRSSWAERAMYYAARLRRLNGQWSLAERGYRRYLGQYKRGAFAEQVRFEQALCLLLSGKPRNARVAFERLAKDARNDLESASNQYLAAVAAQQVGDAQSAAEVWRAFVVTRPLSWFALASAARLRALGQTPPTPIQPPPSGEARPIEVKLPTVVRMLRDLGLDRDAEDQLRALEDGVALPHGDRESEARCLAYQQLRTGGRLQRVGQRHVPVRLVNMAPSRATQWAWDCLYPHPYPGAVASLERRSNLPSNLLYAVMRQESAFNPSALSPAGARGLLQLMPATALKTAQRNNLPFDPDQISNTGLNLELGTLYLASLLSMFQGRIELAVAAYNAGPQAVGSWLARGVGMPLDVWVAHIPYPETRHYVWRVMGNLARYQYLAQREAGLPRVDLALPTGVTVPSDAY